MRVDDHMLDMLIAETEKHCILLIGNIGDAFLDLRDLRSVVKEVMKNAVEVMASDVNPKDCLRYLVTFTVAEMQNLRASIGQSQKENQ